MRTSNIKFANFKKIDANTVREKNNLKDNR